MYIFRVLQTVPYSNRPPVLDIIANIHSYFTCNLLVGLAVLLSYKQFGGRPIECMTPAGFSKAWNDYTENYCYTADTYFVSLDEAERVIVSFSTEERRERRISYYQWIPFFLIFQAACFKMPALIWKYFHAQSGMKVGEILGLATNADNSDPETRTSNINSLCVHLQKVLKFHHRLYQKHITPHTFFRLLNMKYSAYYVTLVYLFTKCLFFLNVTAQLNLLNRYLFVSHERFGFTLWSALLQGNITWQETGIFPRVTWCDFDVREMGQPVNHTVQCVLTLNVFMEKVFLILWAWYIVLAALTLANITTWLYGYLSVASAEHFIFNHLEMSGGELFDMDGLTKPKHVQFAVRRFVDKYLRTDGMFILRLIAQHADVVFITDLIHRMWTSHYQIEKQREALRRSEPLWQKHMQRFATLEKRQTITFEDDALTGADAAGEHHNTYPKLGRSRASSVGTLDSFE
uniref:Innexin n=1 Tax=Globodera rostochiensis TaxID=31243 RepID=A0A914I673_GLORO